MILAAHQPNYLPFAGFFHKVMLCDVFVIADHVQYERQEWQNRNKIRTESGWMWLTVPVLNNHNGGQKINEARVDNSVDWAVKHWRSIFFNYVKTPFFDYYKDAFRKIYEQKWEKLADLNESILRLILKELNLKAKIVKSSNFHLEGHKTDLLIEMCKKLNADTYLSGIGAKTYVEEDAFKRENITLLFQDFHHPVYCQRFSPFIPNMSLIDLLFNVGTDSAIKLLSKSGSTTNTFA